MSKGFHAMNFFQALVNGRIAARMRENRWPSTYPRRGARGQRGELCRGVNVKKLPVAVCTPEGEGMPRKDWSLKNGPCDDYGGPYELNKTSGAGPVIEV